LISERSKRIRFTRHAHHKFELLKKYGFSVSEDTVREAVTNPSRLDGRDDQLLALKPINPEYAIRVVYKIVNDNIVVVTFYPVRRERFSV